MSRKPSLRVRSMLTGLLLLCACTGALSQNPVIDSVNRELRRIFSPLSRPSSPKWFLYDMAAHTTDSLLYQSVTTDTTEAATWMKVYEEMYHSAYDSSTLLHPDILSTRAVQFHADTIPVGIINYSFYRLKQDALTTGNYFNFDTVNTVLTDKNPRSSFPYNEGVIFMASPLVESGHFSNPVFRIDPAFIFFDSFNAGYFNNGNFTLKIDFGDGNGFISFDPRVVTHRQVTYRDGSPRLLRVVVVNRENVPTQSSTARFIPGAATLVPPDETFALPGITAGLYRHCNDAGGTTGRTVIYLSGFDFLDNIPAANRTVEQIYNDALRNDRLMQLKNIGYNFLVVDWENSRIDMRFNALYLVNLIEQLKCNLGDREQFVIMGESIGALIARYALTYMESEAYQQRDIHPFFADQNDPGNAVYLASHPDIFHMPTNWCRQDRMHNTRLFLSLDGPNQGANLPLSIQLVYRDIMNVISSYIHVDLRRLTEAFNLLLDGQAARQVLIYHVDTESGLGFFNSYRRRDEAQRFFGQLAEMGNYPRLCKVVLLSNGSLDGERQTNFYNMQPRNPGDRLLDINLNTFARILGIRVPIFGVRLFGGTNPDGQGKLVEASAGFYSLKIKFRLFGVRIQFTHNTMLDVQHYADVRPYCTAAGGWIGLPTPLPTQATNNTYNLSNTWILNLFDYATGFDGGGCWRFDSHVGWNGFASVNVDLSVCSDGMHFCLVPLQSALDYGHIESQPLNMDIQHEAIPTRLANMPLRADLMLGYTSTGTGIGTNQGHVGYRNDMIENLHHTSTVYSSCETVNTNVQRGIINLEIGDEELYLDNATLRWDATYQSEYDIYVNFHNPYYDYDGAPGILDGFTSRDADFGFEDAGFASFLHDDATQGNVGFLEQRLDPSRFLELNTILQNCCINFERLRRSSVTVAVPEKKPSASLIKVYPNPSDGQQATLKYVFKKAGKLQLDLFDTHGRRVLHRVLPGVAASTETNASLDLSGLHLRPGLYLVRLNNGSQTLNTRLIVGK